MMFRTMTMSLLLGGLISQSSPAAGPPTGWLESLDTAMKEDAGDAKERRKRLNEQYWKQTAEQVGAAADIAAANDLADCAMLLAPVIEAMDAPDEAGKRLAAALGLAPDKVGAISGYADLVPFADRIFTAVELERYKTLAAHYDYEAIERSIEHLAAKYSDRYPGDVVKKQLAALRQEAPDVAALVGRATPADMPLLRRLVDFRRKALYEDNPEAGFDRYLAVRRFAANGKRSHRHADRPANWQGITSMPGEGRFYRSEILSMPVRSGDPVRLLENDRWTGHLDLDFDGKRLMYTTNSFDKGDKRPWDVHELDLASGRSSLITGQMPVDTDSYDSCYLPDGRILFINTSGYQGVPCVSGSDYVGNIHLLDRKQNTVRRLTLDQDNNWFPTLLHDGRVMFLRWEYTESAHYFSRVLMHMNPDGSDQKEYYGSNSYWPNSLFNAKAIPGKPGMFVGIVSGHHGEKRVGELVLFDINRGRKETEGAVQKIPGYGKKVENVTKDELVNGLPTPMFAEPYPLSDTYFLAASNLKPGEQSMNIVFCDVFDNIVPLTSSKYFIYGEPRPVKATAKPPVIPDRVKLDKSVATAYITDVYEGRPMRGVPRGEAKSLRVFMSEYSPRNTGSHYAMGMESNWDLKVLYGTAPINEDGSAMFEVPANQPVTVQVLDGQGRALAWMRSWFTAMPGETLSCIGCHENQNDAPPAKFTIASRQRPAKLTPWYGEPRTFSFLNEVQPVLDRNCIACHNAKGKEEKGLIDLATIEKVNGAPAPGGVSYWSLHPYVRRNGPEGDYQGLTATEFTADTSELIQLLEKGHYGVELTKEDMDRLVTWIDMNAPYLGHWPGERNEKFLERRYELHKLYTTITRDYATMDDSKYVRQQPVPRKAPELAADNAAELPDFPFSVQSEPEAASLDLGDGVTINLRKIPAGSFMMGSSNETPSESPRNPVAIERDYWMGETEVTLAQYRQFDPGYENGWYDMHYKDQVKPGYDMNDPAFPVIRVSWEKAMAFCKWLSEKTGRKVSLPTEAQWEYAARAGSGEAFPYSGSDFSKHANLADVTIKELAVVGIDPKPMKNPDRYYDFVPRDEHVNDGVLHLAPVASYHPNAFHLYDMIGNVAEWTRSKYQPYPWNESDGRNGSGDLRDKRVVRGGSWRDRPVRATVSWRWGYPAWRPVYNVGFRIVVED